MSQAEELGPEFNHMALLVSLAERWLVDVGFGDSFVEPLLLDERAEQTQGGRAYRIRRGRRPPDADAKRRRRRMERPVPLRPEATRVRRLRRDVRVSGTGARLGKSDYLVAEADEFDRSFLRLQPIIAVITNIDVEHLDTYRDLADIRDAFVTFAQKVPFFGQVIICLDDPNVQASCRASPIAAWSPTASRRRPTCRRRTCARTPAAAAAASPSARAATACSARCALPMPGTHNVQNALAAIAVALGLGLPFAALARVVAAFGGVHRRFERLGSWRGATVIDDYAHHPAEVTATLAAAREVFPGDAFTSSSSRTSTRARASRRTSSVARCWPPTRHRDRRLRFARGADPRRHRRAGGRGGARERPSQRALLSPTGATCRRCSPSCGRGRRGPHAGRRRRLPARAAIGWRRRRREQRAPLVPAPRPERRRCARPRRRRGGHAAATSLRRPPAPQSGVAALLAGAALRALRWWRCRWASSSGCSTRPTSSSAVEVDGSARIRRTGSRTRLEPLVGRTCWRCRSTACASVSQPTPGWPGGAAQRAARPPARLGRGAPGGGGPRPRTGSTS